MYGISSVLSAIFHTYSKNTPVGVQRHKSTFRYFFFCWFLPSCIFLIHSKFSLLQPLNLWRENTVSWCVSSFEFQHRRVWMKMHSISLLAMMDWMRCDFLYTFLKQIHSSDDTQFMNEKQTNNKTLKRIEDGKKKSWKWISKNRGFPHWNSKINSDDWYIFALYAHPIRDENKIKCTNWCWWNNHYII